MNESAKAPGSASEPELGGYYLQKGNALVELLPVVPQRVLDVGCAGGELGRALRARGVEYVAGIELHAPAAERASQVYDRVVLGDVEQADVPADMGTFDCLVYGDVLEHTRDPLMVLQRHLSRLTPGGWVLISVPSVRFYRVVLALVFRGEWTYADSGVL